MTIRTFLKNFDNYSSIITVYTPESTKIFEYTSDAVDFYGKNKVTCWDISITSEGQPQLEIWV